jgi:hypothetical protein
MRLWSFVLLVVLTGCGSPANSIGHGYHLVDRTEDMHGVQGAFEAFAQYSDLYYFRQRLGTPGQYSISPSGRFAMFEESGKLKLFDRHTRKTREVTDGSFAVPSRFTWNESAGDVEVEYYEKHVPSRFQLR